MNQVKEFGNESFSFESFFLRVRKGVCFTTTKISEISASAKSQKTLQWQPHPDQQQHLRRRVESISICSCVSTASTSQLLMLTLTSSAPANSSFIFGRYMDDSTKCLLRHGNDYRRCAKSAAAAARRQLESAAVESGPTDTLFRSRSFFVFMRRF